MVYGEFHIEKGYHAELNEGNRMKEALCEMKVSFSRFVGRSVARQTVSNVYLFESVSEIHT